MKIRNFTVVSLGAIAGLATIFYAASIMNSSSTHSSEGPSSHLVVNFGEPRVNKTILGYGNGTVEFVTYEEFPVVVSSPEKASVKLEILNTPKGVWTKLLPSELVAGSEGNSSTLMLAGAVKPFVPSPNNVTISLHAKSNQNKSAMIFLPVIQTENLTVLDHPSPILFPQKLTFDPNGTSYQTFGVVYDTTNESDYLSVNMFVSGLLKDQKIYPLPPWLKIVIPEKSFLLKPNMPYYFVIAGSTSQAPIVDQTIVIDETIDGQRFSQDLHITVLKPVRSR